jgi:hypothetical protein
MSLVMLILYAYPSTKLFLRVNKCALYIPKGGIAHYNVQMYIYKTNNISHIHVTCLEFSFFIHLLPFFKVLVSNAIYTEIVEQQEALML